MSDGSLARRYARALVGLGQDAGLTDQFGADLGSFVELISQDDGLLGSVLGNPGITTLERRAVLNQVLDRMSLQGVVKNFLRLLVDKNRFEHLADIYGAYGDMADDLAGRVRCSITTARPLSPTMLGRVRATLEGSTGKDVILEQRVDPGVIGGMVVRLGDTVFDASVRARLSSMQDAMLRPAAQA